MNWITKTAKLLFVSLGILTAVAIGFEELISPDALPQVPVEQTDDNQEESRNQYIQSFDLVVQNIQLQLDSPYIPEGPSFVSWRPATEFVETAFRLTSTNYFRILFRLIIATNAP